MRRECFSISKKKKSIPIHIYRRGQFFYFDGRTAKHTIIEISIFEGKRVKAKNKLPRFLLEKFENELETLTMGLEITIFETPMHNLGICGKNADELSLNYKVNV